MAAPALASWQHGSTSASKLAAWQQAGSMAAPALASWQHVSIRHKPIMFY